MQLTTPLLLLSTALAASAAPFSSFLQLQPRSLESEAQTDSVWKIHESCNGTQRAQIGRAIDEMKQLAHNSIHHLLNHPGDELFVTYFGADADPAPVIGYYTQLIYGNKGNALLRCDNPDDNCRLPEWNGHWRGNNATAETVICELSYTSRRPLEKLCAQGFQLATDNPSLYFGADLMHRAFHVPEFVHEKIHHYADKYADCLELARENSTAAVQNQHSLQYYALDVFSRKLTKWGCVGEVDEAKDDGHAHGAASSSSVAASTTVAQATATAAAQSNSASKDCHTHADGSIHCGTH
ncbi:related to ph-regulated antigen pra1 precursor [Sporisorium reilianum f. sp. reilianum]|uniref:Related to ph-regulated antigen pra1 n=1 Tax=Sporisorium reilianum f. sp. reilianum TaxID=72559 RepID=A0A2N8UEX1_9BASI|nr:related to ph-regulated antigen pra1 precursor [Sporisorium reilianum f. sp. reilianum]